MSETTAGYETETKANNTAILTQNGVAINSKDFWGYAIKKVAYAGPDEHDSISYHFHLVACRDDGDDIVIYHCTGSYQLSLDLLAGLLQAIDKDDRVWDVLDHFPF